jgi:membrane protein YqaA with SNARE-associated domain
MCYNAGDDRMNQKISHDKQAGVEKEGRLRKKVIPLLTLLLVVAVTVGLFVFSQRCPGKIEEFESYGYLGAFLISMVSNATVILPVPGILVFLPIVTAFNPVLLGLVGATGGVIGEITGYMAGYSGSGVIQDSRMYARVEGWMKRWGAWAVFVFAAVPLLPLDIAGMVAGAIRFPLWKFLLVAWVGKSLKYIGLLVAAFYGWELVLPYFS